MSEIICSRKRLIQGKKKREKTKRMEINTLSNHLLPIVQNDLFEIRLEKSWLRKEKNTRSNGPLPFVQIDLLSKPRGKRVGKSWGFEIPTNISWWTTFEKWKLVITSGIASFRKNCFCRSMAECTRCNGQGRMKRGGEGQRRRKWATKSRHNARFMRSSFNYFARWFAVEG